MTDRELKHKIYGYIINCTERYATLEGISVGLEFNGGVSEEVNKFISELMELMVAPFTSGNPQEANALKEYAERHFANN